MISGAFIIFLFKFIELCFGVFLIVHDLFDIFYDCSFKFRALGFNYIIHHKEHICGTSGFGERDLLSCSFMLLVFLCCILSMWTPFYGCASVVRFWVALD